MKILNQDQVKIQTKKFEKYPHIVKTKKHIPIHISLKKKEVVESH